MEHASSTRMQHAATQQGQEQNGQEDMPLIDALENVDQTPLSNSTSSKKKIPSEALKKIRDQQTLIKQLQRQLENTSEALHDSEHNKAELHELLHATNNELTRANTSSRDTWTTSTARTCTASRGHRIPGKIETTNNARKPTTRGPARPK